MLKRIFDVLVSGVAIVLLFPVLVFIAWQIRRKMGSPVLFRQVRPGQNERPFEMIKFRTMRNAYDRSGKPLPDSARITSFGRFLRSSSLDELPELWNVLKGDMSIVGPRPLLVEYLEHYTEEERLRHTVRPGITGLAQISGRNALTWEQKLSLDVEYVRNRSFWMDLRIIFLTFYKVFKREDILDAAPQGSLSSYRARKQQEN